MASKALKISRKGRSTHLSSTSVARLSSASPLCSSPPHHLSPLHHSLKPLHYPLRGDDTTSPFLPEHSPLSNDKELTPPILDTSATRKPGKEYQRQSQIQVPSTPVVAGDSGLKDSQPSKRFQTFSSSQFRPNKGSKTTNDKGETSREGGNHSPEIKIVEDPFGKNIFREGNIPQPANPYFITQKKKRASELVIPTETIKAYRLHLPDKTVIRDPDGRKWNISLSRWKCGRLVYRGGSKDVCIDYNISGNDICICEFVKCKEFGVLIQLKIIRQGHYST